ncbi:Serine/threonine-protein phosphatase 4 regulatory subunit [Dirofilaria immitis]
MSPIHDEDLLLLCKIVTWPGALTKRWIFENFLGRYSILLQDTAFHVRKTCVTILGKLAIMFGRNFTEQFAVPFLLALSEDLAWGVRKSSCEVFVDVANNCTMETRERKLAPRFITLLHDTSRWVTHVAFQQLGRFIATFADANRMSLEIRDGRLVVANSDIVEESKSARSVIFPESDINVESKEYSTSSSPQDQSYILNELTCLMDSWAMSDDSTSNNSHILECVNLDIENGVAASCSTHSDLTKLICNDNGDSSSEEDDDIEEPCPMDIEDDDIEISFEESSQMDDEDDMNAYTPLTYWSTGIFDIDLRSYGKSIANYNNNIIKNDKNNVKQLVAEFIQRRSNLFYDDASKHVINDAQTAADKHSKYDRYVMEEDDLDALDVISDELNKTFTGLSETGPSANSIEDDENERMTSSAINIRTQMVIPQALLDSFVHMVSPCDNADSEINRQCAHSFPAVAFTLGRNNWPCIMGTYKQLASDMQWRVRHTLASSIHEIAAIIGEENADAHLVPVFERFMEDVEDVKLGLLNHLYDFFKLVTPRTRQKLLSILPNFLHSAADNGRNWRYRYEYVRQCILLCDLFAMHDINEYLAAIALTLANDRISDVRKEATVLLARILGKFISEEWSSDCCNSYRTDMSFIPITDSFISDIVKGFARSMNWRRRQTFALFCEKSLEDEVLSYEQFSSLLLNDLMRLAGDSVANVRLAFVRSLSKTHGGYAFRGSCDSSIIHHSLEMLLSDKDVDCRRAARMSLGIPDTENAVNAKDYAQRIREMKEIVSAKYHTNQFMSSDHNITSETV